MGTEEKTGMRKIGEKTKVGVRIYKRNRWEDC